ncbi:MAG: CARDB domain-containing protein [Planctomycetia bacterium]|nr:CARDB domain-containing protein [Planctomycetia bacterium]
MRYTREPLCPWRFLIVAISTLPGMVLSSSSTVAAVKLIDLQVYPREQIAPVSSEVILVGGVVASDNHYETNAQVDWTIQEGSVGEFIDMNQRHWSSFWVGDRIRPERITPSYVRSSTLRRGIVLDRGTPEKTDDVTIASGQTWVSVTSAVEGTTYVSANAPSVSVWPRRRQDMKIHWVDCQWQLPAPRISPAGTTETLTTYVKRSNGSPCEGWLVEYRITSGPAATFQPGGEIVTTLRTDSDGKAAVEVGQTIAAPGITTVQVQVTRPEITGSTTAGRLVIGSAPTTIRWASSARNLQRTGPLSVTVGTAFRYTLQVSNSGDLAAENVVVRETVPEGLTFRASHPEALQSGQTYQWNLDSLAPGAIQVIEAEAVATRAGTFQTSVEVQGGSGISGSLARHTITATESMGTPVAPPSTTGSGATSSGGTTTPAAGSTPASTAQTGTLAVRIETPTEAKVGDEVPIRLHITNTGTGTVDRYLVGLTFSNDLLRCLTRQVSSNYLFTRNEPPLAAGETRTLELNFQAIRAGTATQTVNISWGSEGKEIAERSSLTIAP